MRLKLQLWPAVTVVAVIGLAVPAATEAATSGATLASTMTDSRINESSSLAVSAQYPDIAYTANDENDPVYAVTITTGQIVGSARLMLGHLVPKRVRAWKCTRSHPRCNPAACTKLRHKKCKRVDRTVMVERLDSQATLVDPESMATDSTGRLWLGDLGDNDHNRHDAALYAFNEPGAGDHEVFATRYPIVYPSNASFNVETLLINPVTNEKFLVSKTPDGTASHLFKLPDVLSPDSPNLAVTVNGTMPSMISDGDFSPRGTRVILRDGTNGSTKAYVYNPSTWTLLGTIQLPYLEGKGEAVSFDPMGARFLTSREGADSPLYWVPFNESTWTPTTP